MHHALEIDEILLNIITHCNTPFFTNYKHGRQTGVASNLSALARTCRTFKEPALDALWSELWDLSPLARCLSGISYRISPEDKWYSFRRPLQQAEWDTLRSYTRRVHSVLDFGSPFRAECTRMFLTPPDSESLFPNLRYLLCTFAHEATPLLHQPLPSLASLNCSFICDGNLLFLQNGLEWFPTVSSKMREISIRVHQHKVIFDKVVSEYVCRLSHPEIIHCPQIALDWNALSHLSHVPDLTQLTFALSPGATAPTGTLLFSTLRELRLYSEALAPVSGLLSYTQFPTVTNFVVEISTYPSKRDMAFFLTTLQPSRISESTTWLSLTHHALSGSRPDPIVLTADDLSPCTALWNLRYLYLNLGWTVGLTDDQLLALASAWPRLEYLLINEESGWQTEGGITPHGLVRLLRTCRSLTRLALAIDTRGYTDSAPLEAEVGLNVGTGLGLDLLPLFSINVVDSTIEASAVPAMAAFFSSVVSSSRLLLRAWSSWTFTWRPDRKVYADRWGEVCAQASKAIALRRGVVG